MEHPIEPSEFNIGLPHALFGGLKPGPAEELLRHLTAENWQLCDENKLLREALEQLEARAAKALAQVEVSTLAPAPNTSAPPREEHEWRCLESEPEQLIQAVLETAERTAHELRESATADCEQMLNETRTRNQELEQELERALASVRAELSELELIRTDLRNQLRSRLSAILSVAEEVVPGPGNGAAEQAASVTALRRSAAGTDEPSSGPAQAPSREDVVGSS